jgi:hypothetical protein
MVEASIPKSWLFSPVAYRAVMFRGVVVSLGTTPGAAKRSRFRL